MSWFRVEAADVFSDEYEAFIRGKHEAVKVEALDGLEQQMSEIGYDEPAIAAARTMAEEKIGTIVDELTRKYLADVRKACAH